MKTVLIAEDDNQVSKLLEAALKYSYPDYDYQIRDSGRRVIADVNQGVLNVANLEFILSDGNLNGDMGFSMCEDLRKKGYTGPILYIGSAAIPEGKEMLFTDISMKPIPLATLREIAGKYLTRSS